MKMSMVAIAIVLFAGSSHARSLGMGSRTLLQTEENPNSNQIAIGLEPLYSADHDQCKFAMTGSNVTIVGPVVVNVPMGDTATIAFPNRLENNAALPLYNQTINESLVVNFTEDGMRYIVFNADHPVGTAMTVTGGRMDQYNNSDPLRSWNAVPNCYINITFVVVANKPVETNRVLQQDVADSTTNPPPIYTPVATQSPTPSPTPFVLPPDLPKFPCYCSPVNNGETACFNFVGQTSDTQCLPDPTYTCQIVTAEAGVYTNSAGPVFQCTV